MITSWILWYSCWFETNNFLIIVLIWKRITVCMMCISICNVYDILGIYVHGYQSISRRKLYGWVFMQNLCSHSQHKFLLTKRLMRIDDMSWKMLTFVLTFYPATFSACPKPRSGFPLAYVVVFLSSMIWSEM